jgi:hypothetical protein
MAQDSLRNFIAHHDERWLFVAVYISLAVVLSIVLSLFWLVAVAGLHFWLECLRQAQHRQGWREVAGHALWEIKLDVALVLLALAMALYMELILGILGLQSAGRAAAATRVVRFTAWERNLRAVILLADDVARVVQIAVSRFLKGRAPAGPAGNGVVLASTGGGAAVGAVPGPGADVASGHRAGEPAAAAASGGGSAAAPPGWREAWSRGDRFTVGLLAASAAAIVAAPLLTDHSWAGATLTLLAELHPFPSR